MYAKTAAECITAWCKLKWPDETGLNMPSTMANSSTLLDAFDHKGGGTHKYIPADKLSKDLGEPKGKGVYGYVMMGDGSYILQTCRGPLAYWSGEEKDSAVWVEI